jgi:hypothetical protein
MFEQLSAWDTKISLRRAMLNAISLGFLAGMVFGVLLLSVVRLRVPLLNLTGDLLCFVVALAMTVRFYVLALSRAHENAANSLPPKNRGL